MLIRLYLDIVKCNSLPQRLDRGSDSTSPDDVRGNARYASSICPTIALAAIQETLDGITTIHAEPLATLMTLKFQQFEDVSLLAA